MSTTQWLTASECGLLHSDSSFEEPSPPRQIQRFLELCLSQENGTDLINDLLLELSNVLRADYLAILDAAPDWPVQRQINNGSRNSANFLPRKLLGEVLDRGAAGRQPPGSTTPAYLAAVLPGQNPLNQVLLISRKQQDFTPDEMEYAVAAAVYMSQALRRDETYRKQFESVQRLQTLVAIGEQLVEERETIPLLEHIAEQAARLLNCERASIFLWDEGRHELVGRPALGLPNNELRIADNVGVVGRVVQTGEVLQVDDVRSDPNWSAAIDDSSGFQTSNLLCVPLDDKDGKRVGAFEVINKRKSCFTSQDIETLQALGRQTVAALAGVQEREALLRSNAEFEGQARLACQIIGASTPIKEMRSTIDRVANTELPVLVLGESGTGKDVAAKAIHYASHRQSQPFVPVNCAAIAESLLESELFGHEKGAFTDAHSQRPGKFEVASGGTLFLDEIGDLSAGGQAKLLRVLEEKIVYRVGGSQPIPVDTRIIAATNRNLADQVRKNKFREDLFYRLSVVTLELPPLRDRQDDVLLLAEHFLKQFCRDAGRRPLKFSADAKKSLLQHQWPGNVRELRNLLERVAYLCPTDKIETKDLPFISRPLSGDGDEYGDMPLSEATDAFQINYIQKAIERSRGNMSDAAKLLGLHRPNLYRKMRLLKMDVNHS